MNEESTEPIWARVGGRKVWVAMEWDCCRDSLGHNGYDVAGYICDGVSVWPCGRTVDAKEKTGTEYCRCGTCMTVRRALRINHVPD